MEINSSGVDPQQQEEYDEEDSQGGKRVSEQANYKMNFASHKLGSSPQLIQQLERQQRQRVNINRP